MIISMKNYPTVVDAKAWAVKCDRDELIAQSMEFYEKCALGGDMPKYPDVVTQNNPETVGVTFDDAEDAIRQVYGFDWRQCVQYGDLMLIGNRKEMMNLPDGTQIFLHMKNERGENLIVLFDVKKFITYDPNRPSHNNNNRLMMNYCRIGCAPNEKDENTLTTIALIKDDENLLESDVLLQIGNDYTDNTVFGLSFSSPA